MRVFETLERPASKLPLGAGQSSSFAAEVAAELMAVVDDLDRFENVLQQRVSQASASEINYIFDSIINVLRDRPALLKRARRTLHREQRRVAARAAESKTAREREDRRKRAWKEYADWLRDPATQMKLQRADHPYRASLLEAASTGEVYTGILHKEEHWTHGIRNAIDSASSYLIEHDWAAAFERAKDFDAGEFALPDECCSFEMKIDGRAIVALAHIEADHHLFMSVFVRVKSGWVIQGTFTIDLRNGHVSMWVGKTSLKGSVSTSLDQGDLVEIPRNKSDHRIIDVVFAQVRAACIALDSAVATSTPQRAEYRRNAARDRKGPTGYSYNVVTLARRSRAERLEHDPADGPVQRRRLHFRRGHWRHYDDHKTWIKWTLVGDPELGFVDKHYRL